MVAFESASPEVHVGHGRAVVRVCRAVVERCCERVPERGGCLKAWSVPLETPGEEGSPSTSEDAPMGCKSVSNFK